MTALVLLPVESMNSLETLFWERTKDTDTEQQFITDGRIYSDLTAVGTNHYNGPNHDYSNTDSQLVSEFVRQATTRPIIWYHTHPHTETDGKLRASIAPPSFSDLKVSADFRYWTCRSLVTRVIEKFGVWEFSADVRTLPRCRDSFTASAWSMDLKNRITEYEALPIDKQVEAMINYYKTIGATVSFRRI